MATRFEKTVTATEFKAKCLEFMDQLDQRKLDRILITKRGRVVSMAVPPPASPADKTLPPIFGFMKADTYIPDNFDWEAPLISNEELDEMVESTLAQLRRP